MASEVEQSRRPHMEAFSTDDSQPSELPPMDSGRQAWSFVFASFLVECLLWGPVFSIGVYLKYYSNNLPYSSSPETITSLIGTLYLFAGYGTGTPLLYIYNRWPRCMQPSIMVGIALYSLSILAASFTRKVEALVVLQGILPGIAGSMCAFPFIRWIPEWFDKRRGLAAGIIFSGGGVGGTFMPFLNQYLIDHVGLPWTLRISAIMTAVLAGTASYFIKPRLPISANQQVMRKPMPPFFATFAKIGFLGCFLVSLLQGFGFFNVGLFIPRFSDKLDAAAGAGLLAAFNVSCVIAQVMWGHIADRTRPLRAMAISSMLGCIFVLTLWGCGGYIGVPVLIPFAIAFGLGSGGISSMWSQCSYAIAGPDKEQQTMLFSGFSVARGMGAAVGPVFGSTLYAWQDQTRTFRWGSTGSPGFLALIAGSLAASALVGLAFDHEKLKGR